MVFFSSHTWTWELDHKKCWAPKNWCFCSVVLEKTLESPLDYKEIKSVSPKGNQSWMFIGRTDGEAEGSNTLATWWKELPLWKSPWCWERLKAREGDDGGWDGWIASLTQQTWVWASSGSWWWTGKPGVLQYMGSQRVGHDWVTELNWRLWHPVPSLHGKQKGKKWKEWQMGSKVAEDGDCGHEIKRCFSLE